MKVNSTGLGKTVMVAHFAELERVEDGEKPAIRLSIEATEPVHWSIKATVGGEDLRAFARLFLRPSTFWSVLRILCFGKGLDPPESR